MEKNFESSKIVIVHDSASSLPSEYRNTGYGNIIEVPLSVSISSGNKVKEWIDHPFVSDEERAEFVNALDLKTSKISTAQPNPEMYKRVFRNIINAGITEIAVVPMSSELSGSMMSANLAADELSNYANIRVANCKTASIGQGLLITQADMENRMNKFKNSTELVDRVEKLSKNLYLAQGFPSLDYFRRGGRIGRAESMIAGVLGIIPIIGMNEEGQFEPIDSRQRGWLRTREFIINHIAKEVGNKAVRLAIIQFQSLDQLSKLRSSIEGRFNMATDENNQPYSLLECEQSMVLNAHSGPQVVGMGALVLDKE